MKVDKNEATFAIGNAGVQSFIPVRLELAARILPSYLHKDLSNLKIIDELCDHALDVADLLIKAHNETCDL